MTDFLSEVTTTANTATNKNSTHRAAAVYPRQKGLIMFKKFIQRIIEATDRQDAIDNVFYGTKWDADGNIIEYGIDIAYQHDKITAAEHQMLSALIDKLS